MPVTPLHMAAGGLRKDMNWTCGFALMQVAMDAEVVPVMFFDMPGPLHGAFHTLPGMLAIWVMIWLFWDVLGKGALWGGISHLILDSIVHADMKPLWVNWNPLYIEGSLEIVSALCATALLCQFLFLGMSHITRRRF